MVYSPILFMVRSPPTATGVGSLAALPTKINPSSKLKFPSGISTNPPSVKEIRFPEIDNCCSSVLTVFAGRSTKPPSVSEIRFPEMDNCCSSVFTVPGGKEIVPPFVKLISVPAGFMLNSCK